MRMPAQRAAALILIDMQDVAAAPCLRGAFITHARFAAAMRFLPRRYVDNERWRAAKRHRLNNQVDYHQLIGAIVVI